MKNAAIAALGIAAGAMGLVGVVVSHERKASAHKLHDSEMKHAGTAKQANGRASEQGDAPVPSEARSERAKLPTPQARRPFQRLAVPDHLREALAAQDASGLRQKRLPPRPRILKNRPVGDLRLPGAGLLRTNC